MVDPGKVLSALIYALFSIGGAGLASLWFHQEGVIGIASVVVVAILGYVSALIGQRQLPKNPVVATRFLELAVLTPGSLAIFAAAIVVVVSVYFSSPSTAPVDQQKVLGSVSGALAAALTAIYLKVFEDADDKIIGAKVQREFQAHYKRGVGPAPAGIAYFPADSDGEHWVYSDAFQGVDGWGLGARHTRARKIAAELAAQPNHA
jgi:hypothetical protein